MHLACVDGCAKFPPPTLLRRDPADKATRYRDTSAENHPNTLEVEGKCHVCTVGSLSCTTRVAQAPLSSPLRREWAADRFPSKWCEMKRNETRVIFAVIIDSTSANNNTWYTFLHFLPSQQIPEYRYHFHRLQMDFAYLSRFRRSRTWPYLTIC